jgi:hypothetical protein
MSARAKKEVFFFEKKKQKTFAPAPSPLGAYPVQRARNPPDKDFLVLFFKKEQRPSCVFS